MIDEKIAFEEVATRRPDGGHNIIRASVMPTVMNLPPDYVYMNNWCGPMWNSFDKNILWQIISEWSGNSTSVGFTYLEESKRVLSLFSCLNEGGVLSKEDYAWLAERGLIKFCENDVGLKSSWQFVWLAYTKIKDRSLVCRNRDELSNTLTERQIESLDKYDATVNEMRSLSEQLAFRYGFSLGIRLIMESVSIDLTTNE